ncbi:hypothetical protein U8P80_14400 [Rhizobium beringeri]|uniref:hypothetical protein n=1 Tax=Rhizobium TaxID=379 RepID=UPI001F48ACCD|nr:MULTISPECIES: hypothetical protein [Rhizobium]UIJ77995.1 hypothetical protein LZK78_14340 [Rhizobium leguminosarum]WSG72790.1 hypothetical protein U8P80_14400 [Rhizobium beringeri]WSG87205.1 hypothetical protein U8P73_14155 [Rhizobium beringeri]WSH12985.1 hypothetical protein U8P74_14400 [Rhizobium beringeri]WSH25784.1 hypothetical protein U8P75_14155 [Rhizobium beringeri]
MKKSAVFSPAMFLALVASAASVDAAQRTEDFLNARKHCELAHLWKDPPDPNGFSECMKERRYRLHFSPTCQTGSRRAQCYDLQR